MDKACS